MPSEFVGRLWIVGIDNAPDAGRFIFADDSANPFILRMMAEGFNLVADDFL